MTMVRWVLGAQGAMYVVTGLWPLLHMASFEAVTGPKTDDWLVHTVGLLLAVIGAVLLASLMRRHVDDLVIALAAGVALALAAIEVFYVSNGTISRIYLSDAAIEGAIAAFLLVTRARPAGRAGPA
jgi:hypothetical protein